MQKLVTIVINIEKLKGSSRGAFTITDVDGVNELLNEGWTIQEWKFITDEQEDEKAVALLFLNDEMSEHDFSVTSYSNRDDAEEDEQDEEEDYQDVHPEDADAEEDQEAQDAPAAGVSMK